MRAHVILKCQNPKKKRPKHSTKALQSGTMCVHPFLDMITAMVNGGAEESLQSWVDCGCGAGVILFYLMIHQHLAAYKPISWVTNLLMVWQRLNGGSTFLDH
jgi:hypothetical protein